MMEGRGESAVAGETVIEAALDDVREEEPASVRRSDRCVET
jgi:hypothetical protein